MTHPEIAKALIERYVCEVGRELPRKQRDDVMAELRGLLEEALEERATAAGRAPDEELVIAVLRDFGEPAKVARGYRTGPQHLIGPRLYPAYVTTVHIILWVIGFIVVFGAVSSLVFLPDSVRERLGIVGMFTWVEKYVWFAFINVALATLVFALIERFWKEAPAKADEAADDWNPRDLPKIEDQDRISPGRIVAAVYLIVALFVVFNFFPQYFGLIFFAGGELRTISIFDMGFHVPGLLLNIWWGLALALNMALLRLGRWNAETRWAEFGLGIFGAVILVMILSGSSATNIDAEWFAQQGWEAGFHLGEKAREGLTWVGRILHGTLTVFLVIVLIETGWRFYRLLTRYRASA